MQNEIRLRIVLKEYYHYFLHEIIFYHCFYVKSEVPKSYDMPDDFPDDDDYIDEDEESSIELPYLQEYFQDRSSCYER